MWKLLGIVHKLGNILCVVEQPQTPNPSPPPQPLIPLSPLNV